MRLTKKNIIIILLLLIAYIFIASLAGYGYLFVKYLDDIHRNSLRHGAELHADNNFNAKRIHYFEFNENEALFLKPLGKYHEEVVVIGFNSAYNKELTKNLPILGNMLGKITKRYDNYYIDKYNEKMRKLIEDAKAAER